MTASFENFYWKTLKPMNDSTMSLCERTWNHQQAIIDKKERQFQGMFESRAKERKEFSEEKAKLHKLLEQKDKALHFIKHWGRPLPDEVVKVVNEALGDMEENL